MEEQLNRIESKLDKLLKLLETPQSVRPLNMSDIAQIKRVIREEMYALQNQDALSKDMDYLVATKTPLELKAYFKEKSLKRKRK